MEKIDEIKDFMWNIHFEHCNLIQYVDKEMLDELVDNLTKKYKNYHNFEEKRFLPIIINAKQLQEASIMIENNTINYSLENKISVSDDFYQLIELRNKAMNTLDLDELRNIKKTIFNLEQKTKDNRIRDMKGTIQREYLVSLIPYVLFDQHSEMTETISKDDLENISKKLDLITSNNSNILSFLDIETIFYDFDDFYRFLKECKEPSKVMVPTIITNGEYITDYDLQENINGYMFNQRSGVFAMNFITCDTIYHRRFIEWFLEETHDIITTNVKSKRYYKDIKNINNYNNEV